MVMHCTAVCGPRLLGLGATTGLLAIAMCLSALEENPAMAQILKIRSELMISLRTYIEDEGPGQKKAAAVFGVHLPIISDLMRGKIDKFTIDMLVNMLARILYLANNQRIRLRG